MNFCPHGFGQKLDVLATISVLVWKTALFDLAMIVAAPQLRMTWFFFFRFQRGGGGGKRREIDENCNRQPSRLMEMGSNALDRDKRWGEGGGGFGFLPLLFIIARGKGNFFWLWKIKGRENFRWTREGIVELKGCKSRWERRVCFYLVSVFGINWKREREGK